MRKLTDAELSNLTRQERYSYYERLRNDSWNQNSLNQNLEKLRSDIKYFVGHRNQTELSIEEKLNNNDDNCFSIIDNKFFKIYYSRPNNERFTFFWETSLPFSQWHRSNFKATNCELSILKNNSNFKKDVFKGNFIGDELSFISMEQFMMYHKAITFLDIDSAVKIMATSDSRKIKNIGRKINNFDEDVWSYYKSNIVYLGNRAKFSQNYDLLEALVSTKNTTLVEAAPNDQVRGIGLTKENRNSKSRATWNGCNLLGEILTLLRIELTGTY